MTKEKPPIVSSTTEGEPYNKTVTFYNELDEPIFINSSVQITLSNGEKVDDRFDLIDVNGDGTEYIIRKKEVDKDD